MNRFSFFSRASNGSLIIASYRHKTGYWIWSLSWREFKADEIRRFFKLFLAKSRKGQWRDDLALFKKGYLTLAYQDYHKTINHPTPEKRT